MYYRGLDKYTETNTPTYNEYFDKIKAIKSTTILIQSDEIEFIQFIKKEFENELKIIVISEVNTTTCNNKNTTVENTLPRDKRFQHSIDFLSVIKIMSKAKNIICTSGNTSLWIMLYRSNANGLCQYLSPKEYIYGVKSTCFDKNQTNFWIN